MNRIVIDTDPGVDDAHAIMMAFAHPEAQIEAITTVAGGASLERATANTCTMLTPSLCRLFHHKSQQVSHHAIAVESLVERGLNANRSRYSWTVPFLLL
ncbi:MAG: nucleoside hydrolase [Chloroflexi bacterium]|nr:nucleoside hydrolase [Chloroflexota bacterium]